MQEVELIINPTEKTNLLPKKTQQEFPKYKKVSRHKRDRAWSCPPWPLAFFALGGIMVQAGLMFWRFGTKDNVKAQQFSVDPDIFFGPYIHKNDSRVPEDGSSNTIWRLFLNYKPISPNGTGIERGYKMVDEFIGCIQEFAVNGFSFDKRYYNYILSAGGLAFQGVTTIIGGLYDIYKYVYKYSNKNMTKKRVQARKKLNFLQRMLFAVEVVKNGKNGKFDIKVKPHWWIQLAIYSGLLDYFMTSGVLQGLLQEYYGNIVWRNPAFEKKINGLKDVTVGRFGVSENKANKTIIKYFSHKIEDNASDYSLPHRAVVAILGFLDVSAKPGSLSYDLMLAVTEAIQGLFKYYYLVAGFGPNFNELLIGFVSWLIQSGLFALIHIGVNSYAKTLGKRLNEEHDDELIEVMEEPKPKPKPKPKMPTPTIKPKKKSQGKKNGTVHKNATSPLKEIGRIIESCWSKNKERDVTKKRNFNNLLTNIFREVFDENDEVKFRKELQGNFNLVRAIHDKLNQLQRTISQQMKPSKKRAKKIKKNVLQREKGNKIRNNALSAVRIGIVSCKIFLLYVYDESKKITKKDVKKMKKFVDLDNGLKEFVNIIKKLGVLQFQGSNTSVTTDINVYGKRKSTRMSSKLFASDKVVDLKKNFISEKSIQRQDLANLYLLVKNLVAALYDSKGKCGCSEDLIGAFGKKINGIKGLKNKWNTLFKEINTKMPGLVGKKLNLMKRKKSMMLKKI
jgi:hypothetical protein